MKAFWISGCAIAALALQPAIAAALTVWQGDAVVIQANGPCNQPVARKSIKEGAVFKSVLRPKLVDDNGNNTHVGFIRDSQAEFMIILDHGAMPSGTAVAFGVDQSGIVHANDGIPYSGFVQTPSTLTAADDFATLSGRITDFMYLSGCEVTFRATYSRRPE